MSTPGLLARLLSPEHRKRRWLLVRALSSLRFHGEWNVLCSQALGEVHGVTGDSMKNHEASNRLGELVSMLTPWRKAHHPAGLRRVIRCDNSPEYISGALRAWAAKRGIQLAYTQPVNPQQNAHVERYNLTVRYGWLGQYLFESITEVQDFATRWL